MSEEGFLRQGEEGRKLRRLPFCRPPLRLWPRLRHLRSAGQIVLLLLLLLRAAAQDQAAPSCHHHLLRCWRQRQRADTVVVRSTMQQNSINTRNHSRRHIPEVPCGLPSRLYGVDKTWPDGRESPRRCLWQRGMVGPGTASVLRAAQ